MFGGKELLACWVPRQVKTFHDPDFLKTLELAIQYGFPFLFEGCDEYIDPIIDPVLERSLVMGPGGKQVRQLHRTAASACQQSVPPLHRSVL
jgi:hypothetical protein